MKRSLVSVSKQRMHMEDWILNAHLRDCFAIVCFLDTVFASTKT